MNGLQTIGDLITKLEQAETGSRKLSDAVLLAVGWRTEEHHHPVLEDLEDDDLVAVRWIAPDGSEPLYRPDPTRSLDSARALVPATVHDWAIRECMASVDRNSCLAEIAVKDQQVSGSARTPALALCIAVLRIPRSFVFRPVRGSRGFREGGQHGFSHGAPRFGYAEF